MQYHLHKGGGIVSMNANKNLIVQNWQDDTALDRFRMIAPLCEETLDHAKRIKLRKEIAAANDLSYKTIKRYEEAYISKGFEGLKPKDHTPRNQDRKTLMNSSRKRSSSGGRSLPDQWKRSSRYLNLKAG